jgi:hypothetical protein
VNPGAHLHSAWALVLVAALFSFPAPAASQDAATRTYLLRAGCHFDAPAGEVEVLARWSVPPEEITVALFIARRAGVSPEVVLSLRRGRTSWADLAGRYGLGGGTFHVALAGAAPGDRLARAYGEFENRAPREWDSVQLTDGEIVDLVNLRFLTESLGIPAARALDALASAGSWVGAFASVGGRGC